jgi:hypothetical protein
LDPNLPGDRRNTELVKNANPKPYTITEWNHCYPNQYAYETPILIASEALKNGWDGLFQFNFSNGWAIQPDFDNINNYFSIISNAQQLILCSLGSLIYLKQINPEFEVKKGIFELNTESIQGAVGFISKKIIDLKDFTLVSDQNGAIILASLDNQPIRESQKLLLVTIGPIKNNNSGLENGRFNWGSPHPLVKKMAVQIKLRLMKSMQVYELGNNNEKGKEIPIDLGIDGANFSTTNSKSLSYLIEVK